MLFLASDEASFVSGAVLTRRRRAHDRAGAHGRRAARREPGRGGLTCSTSASAGPRRSTARATPGSAPTSACAATASSPSAASTSPRARTIERRRARRLPRLHRHAHPLRPPAARATPRTSARCTRASRSRSSVRTGSRSRRSTTRRWRLLRGAARGLERRPAGARRQLAERRRVPRALRRHDRRQRLLPRPPRHAAPADHRRRTTARRRRPSSTRCARSCARAIAEGAVGLSAGLTYAPGMYASDDELVELCSELTGGAFYCPHHRNYGSHAIRATPTRIEIARRAGVPLHLAHAHLGFACQPRRAPRAARADRRRARRRRRHHARHLSRTSRAPRTCTRCCPGWVHAGGPDAIVARLRDPDLRERLRVELEETGSDGFHDVPVEWDKLRASTASRSPSSPAREGKRPIDVYCERCADSGLSRLGARALRQRGERARDHAAPRAHGRAATASSSATRPHPRGWGTFARYLAVYVRELGVLSLRECVRHMTSLPAQRLGLADRGLVRPGMAADIVVLRPGRRARRGDLRGSAAARRGLRVRGRERRARARRRRPHGRHARAARCAAARPARPAPAPRGCGRARSAAPARSGRSRPGRRPLARRAQLRGEVLGRVAVGRRRPQRGRPAGASGASAR